MKFIWEIWVKVLQDAQAEVLNLTHWHQFLSCLIGAGFRSAEMISSQNALLYAYAFYLVGRKRYRLPEHQLQRLIGRWFFASSLTGRYTGSPETVMDGDLNKFKGIKDAVSFAGALEEMMTNELTNDFWTVTLPANLDSSSARNPELFAYVAAQNRIGAPVLFSHKKVQDLLDPAIKTKKKALERHHLFPRAWLESQGVEDLTRINQVANFALLEWPENIDISDTPPAEYVPQIKSRFSAEDWKRMHDCHALPDKWHLMNYDKFLVERRKLMAAIIRKGFDSLKLASNSNEPSQSSPVTPELTESWKAAMASSRPPSISRAENSAEVNDTVEPARDEFRRRYWTVFRDYLASAGSPLDPPEPPADCQLRFHPALTGVRPWAWISLRHDSVDAGITFYGKSGLPLYHELRGHADEISKILDCDLNWQEHADAGWACFELSNSDSNPEDELSWPRQHEWLQKKLEIIYLKVVPMIKKLSQTPVER